MFITDPIASFSSLLNLLITPGGVSAPPGTAMADAKGFTPTNNCGSLYSSVLFGIHLL